MAMSTFSTGQTVDDLKQIAKLFATVSGNSNFTFPVLTDPHYVPPTRGPWIYSIVSVTTILAVIAVVLRCISKIKCSPNGKILVEDWAIITGLIFTVASSLVMIIGVAKWQFGMHIYDLRFESLDINLKLAFAGQIIYLWATMFIRLSLLLFIRRLYREISQPMFWVCSTFCYINFFHCVAASLAYILQCNPVEAAFSVRFEMEHGVCEKIALYYAFCAVGMIADIVLILLPIDLMRRLRVESRKKVQMLGMFGLGVIACGASIIRFAFLFRSLRSVDASWEVIPTSICCALEDTLAIITSCIPGIKMIFTSSSSILPESVRRASTRQDPSSDANELVNVKFRRPSMHQWEVKRVVSDSLRGGSTCSGATVSVVVTSPNGEVAEELDMAKPSLELDDARNREADIQTSPRDARDASSYSWFDFNASPPELSYDLERALSEGEVALPAETPPSRRFLVGGP